MMYIKPFPEGMSASMTLDALSRLNNIGIDYEMSITNEILVPVRCLLQPEMSVILVPNVFYCFYRKSGSPGRDGSVCLNNNRNLLRFYTFGNIIIEADYQTGNICVRPLFRMRYEFLREFCKDCFDDPGFLD